MADPRTFTLIGEFKDGITPELERINRQLLALKQSFAGVGSRKNSGFRGATQEIGKLVSAHKNLSNSVQNVQKDLKSTINVLTQYRREMGKAGAATRAFQKAGGNLGGTAFTKNMRDANAAAKEYLKTLKEINRNAPRSMRPPAATGGAGGGGRMGGGRGGGARFGQPGFHEQMVEFGFALRLSSQIASAIEGAIMRGFSIGVDLMQRPFKYFVNAFGERVRDELDDLKAANALFSISKRSQNPFVKNMDEAIQFQQETNETFAKMAAALPGVTNQYVQVGKRLSDTAARIVQNDFQGSLKIAEQIRSSQEGRKFYGGEIKGDMATQQKEVIKTILGDLVKSTTLAGMGGRTGAGGVAGAYGLPGIIERVMNEEEVSVGKFQRYASVFSDPAIQDALTRHVEAMNKTAKTTPERLEAVRKMMKDIVTDELVEKMRISVDGINQELRSSLFDPDTGLFGLGRQFENFGKRINAYGQYVNEAGEIVKDISEAAPETLGLFEILRDIISNFGQSLGPLISSIKLVFDPIKKVSSILMKARHWAAQFNSVFNQYREGLEAASKLPGKEFLKDSLDMRASFAAIVRFLDYFKVIDDSQFKSLMDQIGSKDLLEPGNLAAMFKNLIDMVLNSDIAKEIGLMVGEVVGTVIREVSGVTGFLSNRLKSSNKLFEGLRKGFDAAGGFDAMANIFKDVWGMLLNLAWQVVSRAPAEVGALAAITLGVPAIAQAIGMKISVGVLEAISAISGSKLSAGIGQRIMNAVFGMKPVNVQDLGSTITDPRRMLPAATSAGTGGALAKGMNSFQKFFMNFSKYGKGIGPRFMGFFKGFLGKLSILGAAITTVVSLFQGKDFARSLAEGAGPLLGAALGAALVPFLGPIGPMIGAAVGGKLGQMEMVVRPLEDAFRAIGGTIGPTFVALWDALGTAVNTVKSLLNALVGPFVKLDGSVDEATGTIIAFKIALTPVVAAFQLLEQVVNVVAIGLKGLEMAIAYARRGLSTLNPFADKGKQAQLDAYIQRLGAEMEVAKQRPGQSLERHKQYYETPSAYSTGSSGLTPTDEASAWYLQQMQNQPAAANWKGGLGSAIASEIKNKPAGSDLVIANSSETVIPAAGGYGMKAFVDTIGSGFAGVMNNLQLIGKALETTDQNSQERDEKTNTKLTDYHNQTQDQITKLAQNLASLSTQVSSMGAMGGLGGAGMALGAGYGSAGSAIAGKLGDFIKSTGGAPGSIHEHPAHGGVKGKHSPNSYHYQGRAIDIGAYANEQAGVIARIKQFNAQMGVQPVEFLHAGNDANHQDHVHVAYALGKGNPAFFSSQNAAERWEASMAGRMNVRTVTGNTMEGFGGGGNFGDINVVVNAGSVSDPDQLAYMVAERIGRAVTAAESGALTLNYY